MAGKLIIDYGSDKVVDHFIQWLSGAGEQEYWMWMEARETEEQGSITALRFDYGDYKPGPKGDWNMTATTGRLNSQGG